MRLLIVDQDKDDREMLSGHFGQLGYKVAVAENGRQALDMIAVSEAQAGRAQKFDLVLLDISRLKEDNYRALEQLRADPVLDGIPVIVIATADGIGDTIKCIDLGAQAAVVLKEKVSKMERDLEIGRQVQRDFLPKQVPQPPGWEIVTHFDPARDVAGDFYDVITLPRKNVALVVADVCDKGVGPALFMSLSRSLMRAFSEENRTSGWIEEFVSDLPTTFNVSDEQRQMLSATGSSALLAVELTNDYIAYNHGDMYMFLTIFFGVLDPDTGRLTYINGGHETAFVVGPQGGVKARLTPTGPVVGIDAEVRFGFQQVTLEPGDTLLVYSDGVPDARNPNHERFTPQRLFSLLEQPAPSAVALLERIRADVWHHIGDADQYDDITMLAARRVPE
jgi:two-component system response regulator